MSSRLWFGSGLVVGLAACAPVGSQTTSFAPAPDYQIANEQTVAAPSDITWDRLVRQLSRGFYVINNIDKASRLINFSFSSDSPQDYVDCGTTHRTFDKGDEHDTYDYQVAQTSAFKVGEKRGNLIYTWLLTRTASLEGRANVYVAPKDSMNTTVSVNVRYILTLNVNGTYETESVIGVPGPSGPIPDPSTTTITFSTNEPHSTDLGSPANPQVVTCHSRGVLEKEILAFAHGN